MATRIIRFDPKIMKRDKDDPRIFYDPRLDIEDSGGDPDAGYIVIGTKGHPSRHKLEEVLSHERSHLGHRTSTPHIGVASLDNLSDARHELWAYGKERRESSPQDWNRMLPLRIKQFMTYIDWVPKKYQALLKPQAKRILIPKQGGGNEKAICQAKVDLAQWWKEREKIPSQCKVMVIERSKGDIRRELNTRELNSSMSTIRHPKISRGVYADTKGQRISRRPHKHWKRIY